jgi:hypothetical protein
MNADTELDMWREQWQSETAIPADLRRKVERQSRAMKLVVINAVLVTLSVGGFTAVWAVCAPQPDVILLAVGTWIFLAIAWAFQIGLNRRKWSPSAMNTNAFIQLSIRRCRSALIAATFGACLFVSELVFCLTWIYHHSIGPRKPVLAWLFFSSMPIGLVWLATFAFFSWLVWHRRKKRAELSYLVTLIAPPAEATPHTSFRTPQRARGKNFGKARSLLCVVNARQDRFGNSV